MIEVNTDQQGLADMLSGVFMSGFDTSLDMFKALLKGAMKEGCDEQQRVFMDLMISNVQLMRPTVENRLIEQNRRKAHEYIQK